MPAPAHNFLDRPALADLQLERLKALWKEILPRNRFYAQKFSRAGLPLDGIQTQSDLARLPFTTKAELLADLETYPPYGQNLTYSLDRYCRLHQTSGSSGKPLPWLDTWESWNGLLNCWDSFFEMVGVNRHDRLFFPFSFGPYLGFWTAFEAAARKGLFCLPGGGMSSSARLRFLLDHQITVVLCTPTYALHLGEVAREEGINLPESSVRCLIVAGEPGGSIPATRARIEATWGARLFDHSGLTEVGPVGIECPENPAGLHILETEYWPEVIDPKTERPVQPDQTGELVLTGFIRWGSPLIRYRTGDLVKVDGKPCPCGRRWMRLQGGILGRTDDMVHLRGNNFYPSALENIIRRFPEITEYRVLIDQTGVLAVLRVEIEPIPSATGHEIAERVHKMIKDELFFRAEVKPVPPGTLPRFELKARRVAIRK
ncbi:MAG TPA: AMP-binding protein [Gemmataceae bacterium]|nr:AMP-binding protein [Gemmataceae bacterium]